MVVGVAQLAQERFERMLVRIWIAIETKEVERFV